MFVPADVSYTADFARPVAASDGICPTQLALGRGRVLRVPLSGGARGAAIAIILNVGPSRDGIVTLRFRALSALLRLLNAGDKAGMADQFHA